MYTTNIHIYSNIRVVAVAVDHEVPGDQALPLPLEHGERLARCRTLFNLYKCMHY